MRPFGLEPVAEAMAIADSAGIVVLHAPINQVCGRQFTALTQSHGHGTAPGRHEVAAVFAQPLWWCQRFQARLPHFMEGVRGFFKLVS